MKDRLLLNMLEKYHCYGGISLGQVNLTLEESFKLIVMFFGLTNSLTIFHIIINELLKNLINMEQVANFIDEILVETKSKEEHNKLIKEILIRMEKKIETSGLSFEVIE